MAQTQVREDEFVREAMDWKSPYELWKDLAQLMTELFGPSSA